MHVLVLFLYIEEANIFKTFTIVEFEICYPILSYNLMESTPSTMPYLRNQPPGSQS